jgi:hypothetical protein
MSAKKSTKKAKKSSKHITAKQLRRNTAKHKPAVLPVGISETKIPAETLGTSGSALEEGKIIQQ